MKVGPVLLVLVFNVGILSANAWDVAVAVGGKIEFLNASGLVLGNVSESMSEVGALAYSSEQSRMFFTDNNIKNGSIFEMSVPRAFSSESQERRISTVVSKQVADIKGIAYDDKLGILYWTNGAGHTISYLQVPKTEIAEAASQPGQQLLRLEDQVPMGLAIDSCERYLYWTNCDMTNPTIERSLLNGADRKTLINTELKRPYSIVVDQTTHRIYWVEELPGYAYRIGSADLNGNVRRVLKEGLDHQPFSLAVAAGHVFWTDHINFSIWSLALPTSTSITATEPHQVAVYHSSPKALVSSESGLSPLNHERCKRVIPLVMKIIPATVTKSAVENPVTEGSNATHHICLNEGIWISERGECDCLPGYKGKICEVKQCLDYCVHGQCQADAQGPQCSCPEGYSGQRCEVYACHNFCLSGSTCSIDLTGRPNCHCQEGFSGERCEVNFTQQQELKDQFQEVCKTFCKLWAQSSKEDLQPFEACSCEYEVTQTWSADYLLIALLAFCSFLLVIVAVLTKKVFVLRRRPRIKKRIIVNKSVTPLTCRPSPGTGGEQCEITIENCCNMNICETPCFEPDFRQPQEKLTKSSKKGEKEEKKTLLGSMELPPDDLY